MSHSKWESLKLGAITIIGLPLMLFSLPLTLPYAIYKTQSAARHMKQAAATTSCDACNAILGKPSLKLADARYKLYVQRLWAEHSGAKLQLVRHLYAVCVNCGTGYDYDEDKCLFVRLSDDEITDYTNQSNFSE